jgi:hypothetical protein
MVWMLLIAACDIIPASAQSLSKEHVSEVSDDLGIKPETYIGGVKGKFDEWTGYVDGKLFDVAAGYEFTDPLRGELFVSDHPDALGDYYETLAHSGPIDIVAENGGVLTLKTKVGTFEKSGDEFGKGHTFIKVDHSTTFYFDLRSRKFIKPAKIVSADVIINGRDVFDDVASETTKRSLIEKLGQHLQKIPILRASRSMS